MLILEVFHSNAIDLLCSGQLPKSDIEKQDYEKNFSETPKPFTTEEREEWLSRLSSVAMSSDAFVSHRSANISSSLLIHMCSFHSLIMFFELADPVSPFHVPWESDPSSISATLPNKANADFRNFAGVKYIACPLGSQADRDVISTCEKLKITFVEQSVRLVGYSVKRIYSKC